MYLIRVLRFIASIPIITLLEILKIYNFILLSLDFKNHSSFFEEYLQNILDNKISKKIFIDDKKFIKFYKPSKTSSYRVKTFFYKEPDTINWMIKNGKKNKVMFDIGANMGVYSIFYAKKFNSKVFAFEPSIRNLDLLTRNITLNGLGKNITVFSNPLNNEDKISEFFQLDYRGGNAGATFDSNLTKKRMSNQKFQEKKTSSFQTYGISIDNLIEKNVLPLPNLIKIDVDGNEFNILKGLKKTLRKQKKISLLIETRKNTEQKVNVFLKKLKLNLVSRREDNQIWKR